MLTGRYQAGGWHRAPGGCWTTAPEAPNPTPDPAPGCSAPPCPLPGCSAPPPPPSTGALFRSAQSRSRRGGKTQNLLLPPSVPLLSLPELHRCQVGPTRGPTRGSGPAQGALRPAAHTPGVLCLQGTCHETIGFLEATDCRSNRTAPHHPPHHRSRAPEGLGDIRSWGRGAGRAGLAAAEGGNDRGAGQHLATWSPPTEHPSSPAARAGTQPRLVEGKGGEELTRPSFVPLGPARSPAGPGLHARGRRAGCRHRAGGRLCSRREGGVTPEGVEEAPYAWRAPGSPVVNDCFPGDSGRSGKLQ